MDSRNSLLSSKTDFLPVPKPLVSEISVYSPARPVIEPAKTVKPKIGNENSKTTSNTNSKNFSKPPPNRTTTTVPLSKNLPSAKQNNNSSKTVILQQKQMENNNNNDLVELKDQLKQQNAEIVELKKLIQQLAVQNQQSAAAENADCEKFVDVGVQNDGVCPHCEKPLTSLKIASPKHPNRRIRVSEQLKSRLPKMPTPNDDTSLLDDYENKEENNFFVDKMLGAAQKWLQPTTKVEEKIDADSEIESLTARYLPTKSVERKQQQQRFVCRSLSPYLRQTVTMEREVSLIGVPSFVNGDEMSVSSQEFLRRYDVHAGGFRGYPPQTAVRYPSVDDYYDDRRNNYGVSQLSTISERTYESDNTGPSKNVCGNRQPQKRCCCGDHH